MAKHYNETAEEVLQSLNVTSHGLTDEEVALPHASYGFNELEEAKKKSTVQVFFEQFKDFLVIILLVAARFLAFIGEFESSCCHCCCYIKCDFRYCSTCKG